MSLPEPHVDLFSDLPGLEVAEGPRPGTPKIEQSLYDPYEPPSFAEPQLDEHTYWFGTPAPPLSFGRALYQRLTGLFNALLPRFFTTGPAQPLLPLSAGPGLIELGAQDALLFRTYNSYFFSLLLIPSFSWN